MKLLLFSFFLSFFLSLFFIRRVTPRGSFLFKIRKSYHHQNTLIMNTLSGCVFVLLLLIDEIIHI